MTVHQKPRRRAWIIGLAVVAIVAVAGYFALTRLGFLGQGDGVAAPSMATWRNRDGGRRSATNRRNSAGYARPRRGQCLGPTDAGRRA